VEAGMTPTTLNVDGGKSRFEAEIMHLRREYLSVLVLFAIAVTWLATLRALRCEYSPGLKCSWQVPIVLAIATILTVVLRWQHPRLAAWALILTLTAANAMEMGYFPHGVGPYLFCIIVMMAAPFRWEHGALFITAVTLAVMIVTARSVEPPLSLQDIQGAVLLTLLTGFVSWQGTRQLFTVLGWSWHSAQHALAAANEAQAHRSELWRLNKELGGAYQRIENMNRMLILARKEAEEARMLKVQFANAVSHELRNPLNLIIGFSDMMVNSPELYGSQPWPPQLKDHIQRVHQSSQHLSRLVDDVLDLARIDAYRLALNKEQSSVADVILEAVEMVEAMYDASGLYLRTEIDDDIPTTAFDYIRIRQVLLNLLMNAQRFTREGGVTVEAVCHDGEVIVSVTDTGIGIAEEDIAQLFEAFSQIGGSWYRHDQGFGLGLAISKQLIELHDGRVWVESSPGTGSTFSFSLPVGPVHTHRRMADPSQDERFWSYLEQKAEERKPIVAFTNHPAGQRLLSTQLASYDITWLSPDVPLDHVSSDERPFAVVSIDTRPGGFALPSTVLLPNLRGVPFLLCHLPHLTNGQNPAELPDGLSDYLVKPLSRWKLAESLNRFVKGPERILVVEDDAATRELMRLMLKSIYPGSEVIEVDCGRQALCVTAGWRPDVIVLDLTLPDIDGLDLASQIQQKLIETFGTKTAIVAVTARDYPAEPNVDLPDVICCARLGRFNEWETGKVLQAVLQGLSPDAIPPV
jgi:signal transduction histidine kinase/CheY-like chemotaxis protein